MAAYRRAAKPILYGTCGLALVASLASPAHAWTWARNVTVYNGAGLCVQGSAGIDHRRPGTLSGNLAYADAYALTQGCGTGLAKEARYAAVRLDVHKWNGSAWTVCRRTEWKYGATGQRGGEFPGPFGPSQVFDYGGSASCGAGYYGTMAYPYIWDGSAWRGRGVWSGHEHVP